MSASIEIFGINQKELLDSLPVTLRGVKEKYQGGPLRLTVEELSTIYYDLFIESPAKPENGFTLLFRNRTKRTSFLLVEMMDFYFKDFHWNNENNLEEYKSNYILNKDQLLGLTKWYWTLSVAARKEEQDDMKYRKEARYILDDYYEAISDDDYEDNIAFWDFYKEVFDALIGKIQQGNFDYYFYVYIY